MQASKRDRYTGGPLNAEAIVVVVTNSIALYNAIELLLLIFVTFKRYTGLYFWSLFWASFGIIPYAVGYMVVYFQLSAQYVGLILDNIGWILMVSGQSFVLYSRLHLVLRNRKVLRAVLAMILIDALIFHIPTVSLIVCATYGPHPAATQQVFNVYEKLQMTGFCIQEFIISGLYVWKTVKLLNVVSTDKAEARRTMWQLFSINMAIIAMDIALLVVEYKNQGIYEKVFKVLIYSVKLKLEYAILGKLIEVVKRHDGTFRAALGDDKAETQTDDTDFVDLSKSSLDYRYAADHSKSPRSPSQGSVQLYGRSEHVEKLQSIGSAATVSGTWQEKESPVVLGRDFGDDMHQPRNHQMSLAEALKMDSKPNQEAAEPDADSDGDMYADFVRQISKR